MKSLLVATALCFSTLGTAYITAPAAQAQLPANMQQDAQAIGEWTSQFNDFNIEISQLFTGPEFDNLFAEMQSGNTDKLAALYEVWSKDAARKVSDLKATARAFPKPPVIKSRDLKKMNVALKAQYESIVPTTDQVSDMVSQIDSVVKQVMSGDDTGVSDLSKITIKSGQRLITSENAMMEASLQSIPNDHPNYFLIKSVINTNSFVAEILEISVLTLDDRNSLEDRKMVMLRADPHLAAARRNLAKAADANKKLTGKMKGIMAVVSNPNEKRIFGAVIEMLDTFTVSIDTESKLVDVLEQQSDLFNSDDNYLNFEAQIEALDELSYTYVDERLEQQGVRTQLLSQLQ